MQQKTGTSKGLCLMNFIMGGFCGAWGAHLIAHDRNWPSIICMVIIGGLNFYLAIDNWPRIHGKQKSH